MTITHRDNGDLEAHRRRTERMLNTDKPAMHSDRTERTLKAFQPKQPQLPQPTPTENNAAAVVELMGVEFPIHHTHHTHPTPTNGTPQDYSHLRMRSTQFVRQPTPVVYTESDRAIMRTADH
jgi:hypothetical protein